MFYRDHNLLGPHKGCQPGSSIPWAAENWRWLIGIVPKLELRSRRPELGTLPITGEVGDESATQNSW